MTRLAVPPAAVEPDPLAPPDEQAAASSASTATTERQTLFGVPRLVVMPSIWPHPPEIGAGTRCHAAPWAAPLGAVRRSGGVPLYGLAFYNPMIVSPGRPPVKGAAAP